ncbi:MAG: histidine kinase [Proteobacteria bacterium]|nr:histidine kinase [Pseudomonadota bacterium]
MTVRNRVFLGILLVYAIGVAFVLYRISSDLDIRYRESAEESLVEVSHFIASFIEQDINRQGQSIETLRNVFSALYAKEFKAKVYSMTKTRVEMRIYVTDQRGIVIFDSLGRLEGKDYSRWRDVSRSMAGEYGARTTPDIEGDDRTAVMYVGAPIRANGQIVGVVTVGKPVQSLSPFVETARHKIIVAGVVSVLAFVLLALIVSVWLVRPFGLVAAYIRYVKSQKRLNLPRLGRRALGVVGEAYREMLDALAGRHYVSEYVQALTHEIKSPLSSIRGAAELLLEPLPENRREQFVKNILREVHRIRELVDRLLELSALEARRELETVVNVHLVHLVEETILASQQVADQRSVCLIFQPETEIMIEGDVFLLQRALANLLENAIDFSPEGGMVEIGLKQKSRSICLSVRDHGPGIPEYAQDKLFEKFFSLPRPHNKRKSTGLGLAFVKEIAGLHHGRIGLSNAPGGGTEALLEIPLTQGG